MAWRCYWAPPPTTCCTAPLATCLPCASSAPSNPGVIKKPGPSYDGPGFFVQRLRRSRVQFSPTLQQAIELRLLVFQQCQYRGGLVGRALIETRLCHFGRQRGHLRFHFVDL